MQRFVFAMDGARMRSLLNFSYLSSATALGAATCCVLPMVMIFFGLGGSWLAIFGKIAGISFYVLALSTVIIGLAWLVAYRRHALGRLKWWMSGSTALTASAWAMFLNEGRINDAIMTWM